MLACAPLLPNTAIPALIAEAMQAHAHSATQPAHTAQPPPPPPPPANPDRPATTRARAYANTPRPAPLSSSPELNEYLSNTILHCPSWRNAFVAASAHAALQPCSKSPVRLPLLLDDLDLSDFAAAQEAPTLLNPRALNGVRYHRTPRARAGLPARRFTKESHL
jgi:hypothetical protein